MIEICIGMLVFGTLLKIGDLCEKYESVGVFMLGLFMFTMFSFLMYFLGAAIKGMFV